MPRRFRNIVKYGAIETARWITTELSQSIARSGQSSSNPYKPCRLAIISDRESWCSEQQLNPFDVYKTELSRTYNISFLNIFLDDTNLYPPVPLSLFDAVLLKFSYRADETYAVATARRIKAKIGDRPLIYMDGDDDLCIQWGGVAAISDLYIKCHAFEDRTEYTKRFKGKSNLHEYAIEEHGHVLTSADYSGPNQSPLVISRSGVVAENDLGKIKVGWNMALAEDILALKEYVSTLPHVEKTIDCSFRGSIKRDTITGYMRHAAREHLENLNSQFDIITTSARLSLSDYYNELLSSRICVSPFGFGELCWRDFEAVLCRSLLIKPDMGHIETRPDIFQPFKTYIPVKWDLSDLEEVCTYYLENEPERQAIVDNAFKTLDDYYKSNAFCSDLASILEEAGALTKKIA